MQEEILIWPGILFFITAKGAGFLKLNANFMAGRINIFNCSG